MGIFHDHHNPLDDHHDLGFLRGDRRGLIPRGLHGLHGLHNHRGYPQMPPMQNNYGPRRQETYPVEPMQNEIQQTGLEQQKPIIIKYDEKNPELPGKPTRESVRELANWYRNNPMYGDVRVKISGTQIGNRELPPLGSQDMDFSEEDFKKWAFEVMGVGVISEMPEPELPILRKIYGNLHVIEQMRLEKRQKDVTKGTITSLTKMELDNKMKDILGDLRYGNPLEFKEDIDTLNTRIKDQKEYGYLGEEAIDYMFGCIMQAHILGQGKKLTIKDNQPIVETGNPVEDAQWAAMFSRIHFGEAKGGVSKIADYVAAYTYHNVNKDLTGYYGDLSQKIVGTSPDIDITAEKIEQSGLTPSEKSFMSLWLNKDIRLGNIQSRQRDYVERAKENIKGKSTETLKRDFQRDAIGTLAKVSPFLGAGSLVLGFGFLLAMIWKKDSKLAKFFLSIGAALGLVGVASAAPGTVKSIQEWALDGGNMSTQAPRRTTNTGDVVTDSLYDAIPLFKNKWNRFAAAFSDANDWSKLMLDDRIGPKITTQFPVGTMLAVMNPDVNNEYNKHYKGTPTQEADFKKILETLTPIEVERLNVMLQETWKRYRDTPLTSTHNPPQFADLQKNTLSQMIDTIDDQHGWLETALSPEYYFHGQENREALTEFTKNPQIWGDMQIGDFIAEYYKNTSTLPDGVTLPTPWTVDPALVGAFQPGGTFVSVRSSGLAHILTKLWSSRPPVDPKKTIRELMSPK